MGFLSLNSDVMRLILDSLCQADRRAMCLVHPSLRTVAEKTLYSHIVLPREYSGLTRHPLPPLVRTILTRPQLANHILSLSSPPRSAICEYDRSHSSWRFYQVCIPVYDSELRLAAAFVGNCEVDYDNPWIEQLQQGTMDAWLAVLLAHLPRIRDISLGPHYLTHTKLAAKVLQTKICKNGRVWNNPDHSDMGITGSLDQLQTVSFLDRNDSCEDDNTQTILPLFYLPEVKELSVYIDNPSTETVIWHENCRPQPPRCSTLHSLTISKLGEQYLANFLSCTPVLQSFTWIRYHNGECDLFDSEPGKPFEDSPNDLYIDQLMGGLDRVKESLTELNLYTIDTTIEDGPEVPESFHIHNAESTSAFCEFKHLKTLVIPLLYLTGYPPRPEGIVGYLPPNIVSLTLTMDLHNVVEDQANGRPEAQEDVLPVLYSWLEQVELYTPRLKELCLVSCWERWEQYARFDWPPGRDSSRRKIEELSAAVGIELKWRDVWPEADWSHTYWNWEVVRPHWQDALELMGSLKEPDPR